MKKKKKKKKKKKYSTDNKKNNLTNKTGDPAEQACLASEWSSCGPCASYMP